MKRQAVIWQPVPEGEDFLRDSDIELKTISIGVITRPRCELSVPINIRILSQSDICENNQVGSN
jgi:hypothetical protein